MNATDTTAEKPVTLADTKLAWIKERIAEGRTVYLSTTLRHIVVTKKYLQNVRARNGVLEALQGRQGWVDCNRCRLSAQ